MAIEEHALSQPEARGCVYACLAAEDVGTAVLELVGDLAAATDPDVLKIAEYALLKRPINNGLKRYLDASDEGPGGTLTPTDLQTQVSREVDRYAQQELWQDPNHGLLAKINLRRVEIYRDQERRETILGTTQKVTRAVTSSTIALYDAAVVNAAVIHQAGGMVEHPRQVFIAAVKADSSLPRAMTRIHLQQVRATDASVTRLSTSKLSGTPGWNEEALVGDGIKGAKLKTPLATWINAKDLLNAWVPHSTGTESEIDDIALSDVTIGCLISFEPQLVTGYYRHLVDLIERHSAWPVELRA